jgi:DNA-binding transcriptional LysR family regulator
VINSLPPGPRRATIASVDLEPGHLRSFLAIVRFGGYHRAADALHLTQPAVSRHIRRLEEQLGEPLFTRRGRGVQLTPFGERAVTELADVLSAHDRAVVRLQRGHGDAGPFVLGMIENLVDPVLPDLLGVVRDHLAGRPVQLRVDRSLELVERLRRGEVDAAVVVDPGDAPNALEIGTLTLRWWATPELAAAQPPDPFPLVAYDPPCGLRELAFARLQELGIEPTLMAESPHLTGVQGAVRNGLGYALLAAGGDGLRPVTDGPLAEKVPSPLWLVLAPEHRALARPLRAALWQATTRRTLSAAA